MSTTELTPTLVPTPTSAPTPTSVPTPTSELTATSVPTPTSALTSVPTPTSFPTLTSELTPTSAQTPTSVPIISVPTPTSLPTSLPTPTSVPTSSSAPTITSTSETLTTTVTPKPPTPTPTPPICEEKMTTLVPGDKSLINFENITKELFIIGNEVHKLYSINEHDNAMILLPSNKTVIFKPPNDLIAIEINIEDFSLEYKTTLKNYTTSIVSLKNSQNLLILIYWKSDNSPLEVPSNGILFIAKEITIESTQKVKEQDIVYIVSNPGINITYDLCGDYCNGTVIDLVQLTSSQIKKLPITGIEVFPKNKTGDIFNFYVPFGITEASWSIDFPIGGHLITVGIEVPDLNSTFQILLENNVNSTSELLEDVDGKHIFNASKDSKYTFDMNLPANSRIVIKIAVPNYSVDVKITEFKICKPAVEDFCRLENMVVLEALGFLTIDDILGKTDDNIIVRYGDLIEDGVMVYGSCYACECHGFTLICDKTDNCTCPDSTIECTGDCHAAHTVITFNATGVPITCANESQPCIKEGCTTPMVCPGPWSSWSECYANCQQTRKRICDVRCGKDCDEFSLSENRICPGCITVSSTTAPTCEENEIPACVSHYDQCLESCVRYRRNSSCDSLKDDIHCIDTCKCKEGFLRDGNDNCVPNRSCECYPDNNSTVSIPHDYITKPSKCVSCTCNEGDYICKEDDDCCDILPWSEWSPCSVTCGNGISTRTRKIFGSCPSNELVKEQRECEDTKCPCIVQGKVYDSGQTIMSDKCQECVCFNGVANCTAHDNIGKDIWSNENCTAKCYCDNDGVQQCTSDKELDACQEVIRNCDLSTHVLEDTPDRCCKKCVPKMIPCTYKAKSTILLNFTDETRGLCVSNEPQEVGSCAGTCGPSKVDVVQTVFRDGEFQMDTAEDCSCCKALFTKKLVQFICDDYSVVEQKLNYISGCTCQLCS
ncbi:uncharacterized protein LOC106059343 [Biomphalaria glabrata]|uniref:Circumsporozoite protein n=1 Tax=Biomphalaria glabrata TaxID=6526 RepID=A0A9W3AIQ3_BIOGL|nr:uncharacterized protein LOC106059343 [Biomphalaria glabrata]